MAKNSTRSSVKSQTDRFKDLARESEADQDEAAFKKRLEKIAKHTGGDHGKEAKRGAKR